MLKLHRGIAVPSASAEEVMSSIRACGLSGAEGRWRFVIPDIVAIRERLDWLFAKPDLKPDDLFAACPFDGICACGSVSDAVYYAACHNCSAETDYPIVVEFAAPMDHLYVDPRDFLCTAMQFWDRRSKNNAESQRRQLVELFGPAIKRYFDAVLRSSDQTYRIAMCNLATFDPGVVREHYANTRIIGGRYNTRFTSAFFVKTPVEASRIQRVYVPGPYRPTVAQVTLEVFLGE